jgi:hypothetical protein
LRGRAAGRFREAGSAYVAPVEKGINLEERHLIISGKSVSATETLSFYRDFCGCLRVAKADRAGENFIPITDPESGVEKLAQ